MSALLDRKRVVALVIVLVGVLIAGTALSSYAAPPSGKTSTGRALGKSGFAFLGGLRMFAAAVIWNRIDPIFHDYYGGTPLEEQRYMLPHLRMVTMLDPQFIQGYYMASFMVAKAGDMEQGLQIAQDGLTANPESGLMHANLAQLLMLQDAKANMPKMLELAQRGVGSDIVWANADDRYDGLVIFRTIYAMAGDEASAEAISKELSVLKESGGLSDHDHDGDGVQDH